MIRGGKHKSEIFQFLAVSHSSKSPEGYPKNPGMSPSCRSCYRYQRVLCREYKREIKGVASCFFRGGVDEWAAWPGRWECDLGCADPHKNPSLQLFYASDFINFTFTPTTVLSHDVCMWTEKRKRWQPPF
jgi:hypothetical protein